MSSSARLSRPAPGNPSLCELTGADALFDALVDNLVQQIQAASPGLSEERLRPLLCAFRPSFEATYARLLQERFDAAQLVQLAAQLEERGARAFVRARRNMAPELGRRLRELSFEMGKTQI
jgi:hypothetical protein